jgi:transcriptional regulator with PAS, ATPase and Fis domain
MGPSIIKNYFDKLAIQELSVKSNGNSKNSDFRMLIGKNRFLMETLKQAKRIANLNESILITGKSGTGKDLFARYLHDSGNRRKKPFHVVNCAAVHPGLFESEFFGHRKGSFTGAIDNLEGHFQKANGGILVLDEVSEIDINFQAKLLRAIENQEIMPVGRQSTIKIDTRIVAITNRNLEELIRSGKFREDLYYRLNVYALKLPSLEERLDDLEILIEYFAQRYLSRYHSGHKITINPAIHSFLKPFKFRGNIRELENLIAKVMSAKTDNERQLEVEDFKPYVRQTNCHCQKKNSLKAFLHHMESEKIQEVMMMTGSNITHAARILGISRQNLQYRLKRLRGI